MRCIFIIIIVIAVHVDCQFWKLPQQLLNFSWLRQGKINSEKVITTTVPSSIITTTSTTILSSKSNKLSATITPTTTKTGPKTTIPKRTIINDKGSTTKKIHNKTNTTTKTSPNWTTVKIVTQSTTPRKFNNFNSTTTTDISTILDTTTQEVTGTTEESRDNHKVHDFYINKGEKPLVKISSNISQNLLPLPAGASAALVKPTKYHYYPHNQHIYLLPECAIQQVCNAVYVRLNWTQPLCACPSRYRDPCSASLNSDDQHTTELMTDNSAAKKALTLVKTCEPTSEMRLCRPPRDWSLLALQNIRTGKSHYLVICRCSGTNVLEGPMSHDQPTYASVPGIRVYGMMCVQANNTKRKSRPLRTSRSIRNPKFPWSTLEKFSKNLYWD